MSAIAAGNNDGGLRMLEAALSSMPDVEGEFATDYAWSNIAEVQGRLGAREDAKNTALRIGVAICVRGRYGNYPS